MPNFKSVGGKWLPVVEISTPPDIVIEVKEEPITKPKPVVKKKRGRPKGR